jgi:hypothetical protein
MVLSYADKRKASKLKDKAKALKEKNADVRVMKGGINDFNPFDETIGELNSILFELEQKYPSGEIDLLEGNVIY